MAYESVGSVLFISSATSLSTSADAYVGEVTDFNALTGGAAVIDVTHLQSTAKEKMMGLPDMGQLTINVNMVATQAGQTMAWTAMKTRSKRKIALYLNDTGVTLIEMKGYVTSMPITGSVDNKLSRSITVELTGLATMSTVAAKGTP